LEKIIYISNILHINSIIIFYSTSLLRKEDYIFILMSIDEAVILAGGYGRRLQTFSRKPKFAVEVIGRPLIKYPFLSLYKAGVKHFVIVVNHQYLEYAYRIFKNVEADIDIISNEYPEKGNGYSLYLTSKNVLGDEFIVSMCDHIYPSKIIERMIRFKRRIAPDTDILIGGDSLPRYIDINEATKILTDDNGILIDIGKDIATYTYIDIGIFVMNRKIYDVSHEYISVYGHMELKDLILYARDKGLIITVYDVEGSPWKDVDTPEDIYRFLNGEYEKVLKSWMK